MGNVHYYIQINNNTSFTILIQSWGTFYHEININTIDLAKKSIGAFFLGISSWSELHLDANDSDN